MNPAEVNDLLVWLVRLAGILHFLTLTIACFTPIPPGWEDNLQRLPEVHRRFAIAQNVFIGGVIAVCGLISLLYAEDLVAGLGIARAVSGSIALWWLARLLVLPFLKITPHLTTSPLRIGFVMLHLQCAIYALGFGWLAFR
jgi:hypothetical protein